MQNPLDNVKVGFVKVIIKEYFNNCNVFIENLLIKRKELILDNNINIHKIIKKKITVILSSLLTLYIILLCKTKDKNKYIKPINVLCQKLFFIPIIKSLNMFKSLFLISFLIQYKAEQNTAGKGIQHIKNRGIYFEICLIPIKIINKNIGVFNMTQSKFIHKK